MKKLLCFALGASVPFVCVTFIILAFRVPAQTTITRLNFDRVQKGMTFQEVEGILGPFVSYSGNGEGKRASWFRIGTFYKNTDDEGAADLKFDAHDRVVDAMWTPNPGFESTDWFRRVSLHYTNGRFPLGSAVILLAVVLSIVTWLVIALRAHKLGYWQAGRNAASTAYRDDATAAGRVGAREG